jgi:hypothetical protein
MKYYSLNTTFHFGKYNGKTVKEVLDIQPSYLNWCAINLDSFIISDECATEMKCMNSRFSLSSEAKHAIARKEGQESCTDVESNEPDYSDNQTYSNYRGSYAQDEMGFSDQTIDDAFEGDPDLYWNID